MKLCIIIEHCSTGGMPQWVLKYIETYKWKYDISVIEFKYYGKYEVQRKKLQQLIPFYPLYGECNHLISKIKDINPDIIWFNELPETFIYDDILDQIYNKNRWYKIYVTTHSSYTKPEDFRYKPDKIIAVNKWQQDRFKDHFSIVDMWEYPIEKIDKTEKDIWNAYSKLKFEWWKYEKHILNIGLFTPNKNQGELFEITRQNPQNCYHFVGNQAPNFKDYWEPLMKNKPDNCIIWGEREDVDLFYQACDEMYFCSKFELNPICVKEALSYNLPVKMYKLPTYLDDYDNNPLVTYIKKEPQFNINYVNGCFLEVIQGNDEYEVSFINNKTEELVYKTILKEGHWGRANLQYFIEWRVEVRQNDKLLESDILSLKDKRILINFESKSLGDTLAWFPYVEEFRKKHNCKVVVSTFLNSLFKDQYPELEFVEPGSIVQNIHGKYDLGWFYKENSEEIDYNRQPLDPKLYPLQKTACDILGLEYKEIKPKLNLPIVEKNKNIVSIGIHATNQQKYWNNPNGWKEVVNYIDSMDHYCYLLSREKDGYMGNNHPIKVDYLADYSLESIIHTLCESKLFIGVGSGLSWLAWACNIPVILISGFSEEYTEMQDCIRIGAPKNLCRGCFNKKKLDPSNWNYCPENKNFECSRSITSETVIEAIKKVLK